MVDQLNGTPVPGRSRRLAARAETFKKNCRARRRGSERPIPPARCAHRTRRHLCRGNCLRPTGVLTTQQNSRRAYDLCGTNLRRAGYPTCLSGKMLSLAPTSCTGSKKRLTTDIYPRRFWLDAGITANPASASTGGLSQMGSVTGAGVAETATRWNMTTPLPMRRTRKIYDLVSAVLNRARGLA